MSIKETLEKLLGSLSEDRLREILDFAEFLQWRDERQQWQQFGKAHFARAYGNDEPEYTMENLKSKGKP